MTFSRPTLLPLCLLAIASLGAACSKPAAPQAAADKAVPATASGAITPDLSSDRCKLLSPDQIESYKASHEVFTGQPGLEPLFEKGHLFKDEEVIHFKWNKMSTKPVTLRKYLLKNCSELELGGSPLYETPPGSGQIEAVLHTNAAGSDYPDGTPGVVEIISTEDIDMKTMTAKTVIQGRYLVRFNSPKD